MPVDQTPTRRVGLLLAKVGVSAVLLTLLFSRIDARVLWNSVRQASVPWLTAALAIFFANILASTWRWGLLVHAQGVSIPSRTLLGSYLVATFFNNFLPSNIGGDVIRIRDVASRTRSKTLAATIVLMDRGLGLMGLIFVAAVGATMVAAGGSVAGSLIWPSWLWGALIIGLMVVSPALIAPLRVGQLLRPFKVLHPEWIGGRIDTLTGALARFRSRPAALVGCFAGAIGVQLLLVLFYLATARALALPIGIWDLSVIVPISFLAQMAPISMNGFGVREATFSFYFTRLGLPLESGLVLPLVATGLVMLFSLSGGAVYVLGGTRRQPEDGLTTGRSRIS